MHEGISLTPFSCFKGMVPARICELLAVESPQVQAVAWATPPVKAIPFRGRYGFQDVFLPLENIPAVGDVLRLPTPDISWRTL